MITKILFLSVAFCFVGCQHQKKEIVVTFAGSGTAGFADGDACEASFYNPAGIATDPSGNVYIADTQNHAIRKIDVDGRVTTLAGTGNPGFEDGPALSAQFFFPTALAVDKKGNVFVADTRNQLIRMITLKGEVTTLAGHARPLFQNPEGIAVDNAGNVYVSDHSDRIYRIDSLGTVSTFAGSGIPGCRDGDASTAQFYVPRGLAMDHKGNLYVADSFNNMIRKIDRAGNVTTIAGSTKKGKKDGQGDSARFFHPAGITMTKNHELFVADLGNQLIRKIDAQGMVTTYAGNGLRGALNGAHLQSTFWNPIGVTSLGNDILVSDHLNNVIRLIK